MKKQKYNKIMWERKGEYKHYGYLGDKYFLFFEIFFVPGAIFRLTIMRLAYHEDSLFKGDFESLDEAKAYCQDVLVPEMAAIFVSG